VKRTRFENRRRLGNVLLAPAAVGPNLGGFFPEGGAWGIPSVEAVGGIPIPSGLREECVDYSHTYDGILSAREGTHSYRRFPDPSYAPLYSFVKVKLHESGLPFLLRGFSRAVLHATSSWTTPSFTASKPSLL
jgi:hypothetical protein